MRLQFGIALLSLLAASPACAAHLVMPDSEQALHEDYAQQAQPQPWQTQRPDPGLVERPIADVVAARLGIVEGHVELFQYRLEQAPASDTTMKAVVDGGGLKLKVTW